MYTSLVKFCHGSRYNSETLEVKYKGKSIAEVLEMTVDDAVEFFQAVPKSKRNCKTIKDVGLGYVNFRTIRYNFIGWRSTTDEISE